MRRNTLSGLRFFLVVYAQNQRIYFDMLRCCSARLVCVRLVRAHRRARNALPISHLALFYARAFPYLYYNYITTMVVCQVLKLPWWYNFCKKEVFFPWI